jgi:hypothetical protein
MRNAPALTALQNASAKAADMLATSCRIDEAATPAGAARRRGKRLEIMLEQVKLVRTALDDFYAMLERRAEGAIRGDRPKADLPGRQGRYDAAARPPIGRRR